MNVFETSMSTPGWLYILGILGDPNDMTEKQIRPKDCGILRLLNYDARQKRNKVSLLQ